MTGGTPPPRAFVDLHCHSTASDGALAPTAVVQEAQRKGLHALALTDHDTVAGLAEAQSAGERLGVRIVAGVELSAVEHDVEAVLSLRLLAGDGGKAFLDGGLGKLRYDVTSWQRVTLLERTHMRR